MGESVAENDVPRPRFVHRWGIFLISNPLTRIVVGAVMVGAGTSFGQSVGRMLPQPGGVRIDTLLAAVTALGAYALFVRLFESRWPDEVGPAELPRGLSTGFVLGTGLLLASSALVYAGGWSVVTRTAPSADWPRLLGNALVIHFGAAVFEELLLRGVLFRIVERSLGSWVALAVSAVIFGLLHAGNPNATLAAALGLSLQAGVLLAAAFMVSRSLWLPIGIHWGWNAAQAGAVGGTVSGHTARAVVTTGPAGPDFLSGGAFGIEGSVIATAMCAALAVVLCVIAVRRGHVRPGFWSAGANGAQAKPAAAAGEGA